MLYDVPEYLVPFLPDKVVAGSKALGAAPDHDVPDHGALAGLEGPAVSNAAVGELLHKDDQGRGGQGQWEPPVMEAIPCSFHGTLIRVVGADPNDVRFIARDVCQALGLDNTSRALERLYENEKGMIRIHTPGGPQSLLDMSKPGVFHLIRTCRKQVAEALGYWLDHEVLPSIQATGSYSVTKDAPALEERVRRLEAWQGLLLEAKHEIAAKDKALEAKDQVIDTVIQRANAEKEIAEANRRHDQARMSRNNELRSGLRRKGHRTLGPEQGWWIRSDLCWELLLPLGFEGHYEHRNASATVLGKVMRLWGWTKWNDHGGYWDIADPSPTQPLVRDKHYCWMYERNSGENPNSHYHPQLYLNQAGLEAIFLRWNRGLLDATLDVELTRVRNGDYPKAPKAPGPLLQSATSNSGVQVCDICGMPKKVENYEQHHDICVTRYLQALAIARNVLTQQGKTIEAAAAQGAKEALIRYDGGRPAIVRKIVELLHNEADPNNQQ